SIFLVCPREPGQSLRGSFLCCPAHRTFVHCMSLRTAVVVVGALLLALFGVLSLWLDRTTDLLELEARELAKAHESVGAADDLKIRLLVHNRTSFLNQLGFDKSRQHDGQVERDEIHRYLASARQYLNSPEEAALLEE